MSIFSEADCGGLQIHCSFVNLSRLYRPKTQEHLSSKLRNIQSYSRSFFKRSNGKICYSGEVVASNWAKYGLMLTCADMLTGWWANHLVTMGCDEILRTRWHKLTCLSCSTPWDFQKNLKNIRTLQIIGSTIEDMFSRWLSVHNGVKSLASSRAHYAINTVNTPKKKELRRQSHYNASVLNIILFCLSMSTLGVSAWLHFGLPKSKNWCLARTSGPCMQTPTKFQERLKILTGEIS